MPLPALGTLVASLGLGAKAAAARGATRFVVQAATRSPRGQPSRRRRRRPRRSRPGSTSSTGGTVPHFPAGSPVPSGQSTPRGRGPAAAPAGQSMAGRAAAARGAVQQRVQSSSVARHQSSTVQHQVLSEGTNFGDIMSGQAGYQERRTSFQQARDEAEGLEKEERARQRLRQVIAGTVPVFGALTVGAVGLTKSIHQVGAAMLARQRDLSQLDPTIAFAEAQLEISRIGRRVERGRRTGDSFASLSESVNRLEDRLAPWGAAATNIGNRVVDYLAGIATRAIAIAERIPGIKGVLDDLAKEERRKESEAMQPYVQLLSDIRDGKIGAAKSRRKL